MYSLFLPVRIRPFGQRLAGVNPERTASMNPNDEMNERLRQQLDECRDRWDLADDEAKMEATLMLALLVLMIHQPPPLE
jgi:hypothetical protein